MGKSFNTGTLVNGLSTDANGNVGIGNASPSFKLDVTGTGRFTSNVILNNLGIGGQAIRSSSALKVIESINWVIEDNGDYGFKSNAYFNGTNNVYINTGLATRLYAGNGAFEFYTAPSGTAGATTTFTSRFFIGNTGNVGIGTSSPNTKLQVEDGFISTYHNINGNGAGYGIQFFTNGGGSKNTIGTIDISQVGTARSGNMIFNTSNSGSPTERMRITSSGNVGIGTSNPDALLRIDSNVASANNNMLYLYNADFTSTTRSFIRVRNNISAGSTYSSYFGQGADRKTYIIANDTSRNDLVINGDDGYIGMGTKNPSSKLTIIRDSPFNTGDQALRIRAIDGDGYNLWMGASSSGYATIQSYQDNVGGRPLLLNPLNGGNVGIGTSSPSYLLDVSGSIKAGRVVYQWYWGSWQGNNTYWHMKTNLWGGGSPNGNSQYTMSFFKGYTYSYSAHILEGSCGFHNWSGAIYSYRTTGNIFSNVYVSSDGYVVLVIPSGLGETGVVIDWHQHFEYPTRVCQVTAAGLHGSISGKY
jgi:hypothetical protein